MSPIDEPYAPAISMWVELATGRYVERCDERLSGATTATIVPLTTTDGQHLIAKIYDREIDGVGVKDIARDEAAMVAAAELGVASPQVVATDAAGDHLGSPAILMTRLGGAPLAHGGDNPERWVDGLADVLIDVASAGTPRTPLPHFASWVPERVTTPAWSTNHELWADIATTLDGGVPTSPPRFIHRDFHQLNVLWLDGTPTGLVDWVNGCLGPIESDIATGRVNIALAGPIHDGIALADRFLARCVDAGLPWHQHWDLEFIAGVAEEPETFLVGRSLGAESTIESVYTALEALSQRALD